MHIDIFSGRSVARSWLAVLRYCALRTRLAKRDGGVHEVAGLGRRFACAALLVAITVTVVAGCSVPTPIAGVKPYRMEIQQGNFISQEMIGHLKQGLTKEQVRFALGTPLLTDIFHADRWDYIFYRDIPDGRREQRKVTVYFESGLNLTPAGDGVIIGGDVAATDKQDDGANK